MGYVTIDEAYLEDIARAIRQKKECSDTYKPKQMGAAIRTISTSSGGGSNIVSDSVFADFLSDKLTTLTIPASATAIPYGAFTFNSTKLEEINVEPGSQLEIIGSGAFGCLRWNKPKYEIYEDADMELMPMTIDLSNAIEVSTLYHSTFGPLYKTNLILPPFVKTIEENFFTYSEDCVITFLGTPTSMSEKAFKFSDTYPSRQSDTITINVPWSEGEVPGAPWGAKYATINYDYKYL